MNTKTQLPGLNRVTVLIIACFLIFTVWSISGVNASPTPQDQPQQTGDNGQTVENPKTENPTTEGESSQTDTGVTTEGQTPEGTAADGSTGTEETPPPAESAADGDTGKVKEPTFTVPSFTFKGAELDRETIGTFDRIYIDGKEVTGGNKLIIPSSGTVEVKLVKNNKEYTRSVFVIPGILTLLPPLVAIILALIFKDVMISLFIGIFTGAFFLTGYDPITAFFNVADKYVLEAMADKDRASIILFTLLLGGMVGVISKSGGIKGIVEALSRKVDSSRSSQFYTWLMGILIFFDDYTNTLVVGNTMRPITDKWKVSREKLSYIVDSTAAPIASIAMISTWIGFEISLIDQQLKAANIAKDAYQVFLSSLPYRFYPILAMILVILIFALRRDFGPMLKAEIRAQGGKLMKDNAVPLADFEGSGLAPAKFIPARWYNGLIPIFVVIIATFIGLYISGKASLLAKGAAIAEKSIFEILFSGSVLKDLGTVITAGNSFQVLIWSSLLGACTAMILAWSQKILRLRDVVMSFVQGLKSMMMACVILVMAWSLGAMLVELKTADFLVSLLSGGLDYHIFPAIVFAFSGIIAFSTGTSWGTITIMYPLVIPIIISLAKSDGNFDLFLSLTVSSVLAGAVFGDHCSPISDTTIMSSTASSCDHIDHVKTQMPYAMLAAVVALVAGLIPISYGVPYIICLALSIGICVAALMFFGKNPAEVK